MPASARGAKLEARQVPLLEWIVAGIEALVVAGTIGFLVLEAVRRDHGPPDIRLVAERVVPLERGYLVRFRATNQGGSTAAQVTIEGELFGPDGDVETSEVALDYLPPGSGREGGLLFDRNPRRFDVRLRAKGYLEP